jgi:hypothetical protein
MASMPNYEAVPFGPRAYRASLRAAGPAVATVPAAVLAALSWVLLHGNSSTVRGVLGFLLAVLAAPALLIVGAPLRAGSGVYWLAVSASVAGWFVVGTIASRRATRRPVATWRDFWRHFASIAAPIWLGSLLALVVANLILGRAFL